jgi:putative intracellular protease/amidase
MTINQRADAARGEAMETLASLLYDGLTVTEVIRPAAVLSETNARVVLASLQTNDVRQGGRWYAEPGCWRLYESPWAGDVESVADKDRLIGSIQVAYGMPTRYEITIFRATITLAGSRCGYTVTSLCDEALSFAEVSLAKCPRVDLVAPPKPFRMR